MTNRKSDVEHRTADVGRDRNAEPDSPEKANAARRTGAPSGPPASSLGTANSFADLVASRKAWIETVLKPWCRTASRQALRRAALEWEDIAGRADPDATLWTWAWSRFPALVHEGLSGVDETSEVAVTLADGRTVTGFPDARRSTEGQLILVSDGEEHGPFSMDEITAASRPETLQP